MKQILQRDFIAGNLECRVSVLEEDLSDIYPGFLRYTVSAERDGRTIALFRTNSYEYSPQVPLHARDVALKWADEWEHDLCTDPKTPLDRDKKITEIQPTALQLPDVVIVQASPRADGNSSTLALWAEETVRINGMTSRVFFPHDMEIHECIGCYQCFNSGSCVFDDDMAEIIRCITGACLTVICTPVYSNTVPASLKSLIDRFQSYFAARTLGLGGSTKTRKGIVLSVAGRSGQNNFSCIRQVITAFMHTADIIPSGEVFVDSVDRIHDIHAIPGLQQRIQALVKNNLSD